MNQSQRVIYLGASIEQLRWGGNDDPRPILTVGATYTITAQKVHNWHTTIELVEHPGQWFNDASFQYVTEA